MDIEKWDSERLGPVTEEAMRRALEARGYHVTRYVYPPGTVFDYHTHGVDKIDGVLAGRFRISMGGRSVVLEAGDAVVVPRGAAHRAEVIGAEPVVSLDAVRVD